MSKARMIWKNARYREMDCMPSHVTSGKKKKGFEISREELQKEIEKFVADGGTIETIVSKPWDVQTSLENYFDVGEE